MTYFTNRAWIHILLTMHLNKKNAVGTLYTKVHLISEIDLRRIHYKTDKDIP